MISPLRLLSSVVATACLPCSLMLAAPAEAIDPAVYIDQIVLSSEAPQARVCGGVAGDGTEIGGTVAVQVRNQETATDGTKSWVIESLSGAVDADGRWCVTPTKLNDNYWTLLPVWTTATGQVISGDVQSMMLKDAKPPALQATWMTKSTDPTPRLCGGSLYVAVGKSVTMTMAGQSVKAKVRTSGYWCAQFLKPMKPGTYKAVAKVALDGQTLKVAKKVTIAKR